MIQEHLPENCYSKRNMETIYGAVLHHVSAKNINPDKPFDRGLITGILEKYGFSYNLLIERDGTQIELAPENRKTYHAGKSRFNGVDSCNNFMLGVALVGGVKWPYTDDQIISLADYLAKQMSKHRFTLDKITRDNWRTKYPKEVLRLMEIGKGSQASIKHDVADHFQWEILNDMLHSVSAAIESEL